MTTEAMESHARPLSPQFREVMKAYGIHDEKLMETLANHRLGSSNVQLLQLLPMLLVAWADGVVDKAERKRILQIASFARC
jgi:hypothetical protein